MIQSIRTINQGSVLCTVDKTAEGILAKAAVSGRFQEAQAVLLVDPCGYKIIESNWEVSRTDGTLPLGKGTERGLVGLEAYFAVKKDMDKLFVAVQGKDHLIRLFLECVKGLIQAESYLIHERGFQSEADYEAYWRDREKDRCRYYATVNQTTDRWFAHLGDYRRENNLFNRSRSYRILENDELKYCQSTFIDSFHEMSADLCIHRKTGVVRECQLSVFRAPGICCIETEKNSRKLTGANWNQLRRKDLIELLGGADGCYHLVDMIADLKSNDKLTTEVAVIEWQKG